MLSKYTDKIQICINAGGDLKQTPWKNQKVKINGTDESSVSGHCVNMRDSSMATSSGEHGSFIIKDGKNICHKSKSVTVFAPSCMVADALTKVVYAGTRANLRNRGRKVFAGVTRAPVRDIIPVARVTHKMFH